MWQKIAIFSQNGNFLPLNGVRFVNLWPKVAHGGDLIRYIWISICLTKMANALLKVWANKWDCGGYAQKKSSKITKNCQKHQKTQKSPAIPFNQLICTTNMIVSHFLHWLWGLQWRKVLKSILHCNKEIFISPGNSSASYLFCFALFSMNSWRLLHTVFGDGKALLIRKQILL